MQTSAMRNIYILCSNCPTLANTQAQVSFANLQCQWCTDPADPISPQCILVAHGRL